MISNGGNIFAVVFDPVGRADLRVKEIKAVIGDRVTLKAQLCGDETFLGGRLIQAAVIGRRELDAASAVIYDARDGVGE